MVYLYLNACSCGKVVRAGHLFQRVLSSFLSRECIGEREQNLGKRPRKTREGQPHNAHSRSGFSFSRIEVCCIYMKKNALIIAGIVIGAIVIVGFWLYWTQLRGSRPAFSDPKQNIAQLINQALTNEPLPPGENKTAFPLQIPDGFRLSVFASGMSKPRDIVRDPNGTLLVSDMGAGIVYALADANADTVADENSILLSGLNTPHGLALNCAGETCTLYVATTERVTAYEYDPAVSKASNPRMIVDLPTGGQHTTRSLLFLPDRADHQLLISIGSSCNACEEDDERRAAIVAVNADGSDPKLYATGLRNSVFMTEDPSTRGVWATEMGRDLLGDDLPPDEINRIEDDANYGWPQCYGKNVHDNSYEKYKATDCNGAEPVFTPSHIDLPAHSAPLGIAFFPEEWGSEYKNNFLVAYHGSWNRSTPTGYSIVRLRLDAQQQLESEEDFISGWLVSVKESLGRPVDVLITQDKKIYISDDKAGVVYIMTFVADAAQPCIPSGCSGIVCTDQASIVTTCEFREYYACYKLAVCERQPSGDCGWTETDDFTQCMEDKGAVE